MRFCRNLNPDGLQLSKRTGNVAPIAVAMNETYISHALRRQGISHLWQAYTVDRVL